MLLCNARHNNQGFTLIETLIILIIIGILAAITAPSFLAMLSRMKVNDAVVQVQGALQECQREAIRRSKSYSVTLDTTNNKVTGSCLVTGDRTLPNGVAMATNVSGSPIKIQFGFRGTTNFTTVTVNDSTGNIILYESNGSSLGRKCVAISNGIGILRSGTYSETEPIAPPASITLNCNQKELE